MEIRTESNRTYSYNPISNKLSTNLDMGDISLSTQFELDNEYDFSQIGIYTIEITQQCNLRCKYCCYSGEYHNRRKHNGYDISWETLEQCITFICEHCGNVPKIFVCFYGGEALLQKNKIEWTIAELTNKLSHKTFEFTISSNGLLLNESTIDWICRTPNLNITITIDGDKIMHDKNRVNASGEGSFNKIMKNLRLFKDKNPELYKERIKYISTVNSIKDLIPLNDFWMNNDLLRGNRPQHISSIIPNFEKGDTVSIDKTKFRQVYDIALNYIRNGVENILTNELYNLIKTVKNRNYQPLQDILTFSTCINKPDSCFISSKGKLFVCERFCNDFNIGYIETGIKKKLCKTINDKYIYRKNKYCGKCWAQRLCRRCAIGLNFDENQFLQYCENEKMQIELALKYFCELLEFKHHIK